MKDDNDTSAKPKRRKKKRRKKKTASAKVAAATPTPAPAPPAKSSSTNAILFAVVALAAGLAGGWFLRDARAEEEVTASPDAPAPSESAAAAQCDDWAKKVCEGVGDEAEGCGQVRAAAKLLPAGACAEAMADVPGTVEKAKAARAVCDELVAKACKDLGPETETCKVVTERTKEFPVSECQEMMQNYAKVLAQLQQMEKRNAPLTAEMAKKVATGDAPSFGPADAKVTVVEFSDFECPYCAMAAETMKTLEERYGDRVRFVFRQFPLSFHKHAQLAAEAALAAHAQGKFWAFHDAAFGNQKELSREDLEKYAKEVGLDMAKFKKALDDHTYAEKVKADQKLGEEVGVSGTPSFFVGTKRVAEPSVEGISTIIDEQLGG
jgi:protein-disulfide isomerase